MARARELLVDEEQDGSRINVWGSEDQIRIEITFPMEMAKRLMQAASAILATNPKAMSALGKVAEYIQRVDGKTH